MVSSLTESFCFSCQKQRTAGFKGHSSLSTWLIMFHFQKQSRHDENMVQVKRMNLFKNLRMFSPSRWRQKQHTNQCLQLYCYLLAFHFFKYEWACVYQLLTYPAEKMHSSKKKWIWNNKGECTCSRNKVDIIVTLKLFIDEGLNSQL